MASDPKVASPLKLHGGSLKNDDVGRDSSAFSFPRNRPSPADQPSRRPSRPAPYSIQGNNLVTNRTGVSEAHIRRGTGAFIPKYNQYQVGSYFWSRPIHQLVFGSSGRQFSRGTGVFHPRLVRDSVVISTPATKSSNSADARGHKQVTDSVETTGGVVATVPDDCPKNLLQELGLPEDWTY